MTVWPQNNDNRLPEKPFNPITGGFVTAVDGMTEVIPQQARAETLTALKKIRQSFSSSQGDSLMSGNFWSFKPSLQEPTMNNSENPNIMMVPAQMMTDTPLSSLSSPPVAVKLHTRILDEVYGGRQHLAVVGTKRDSFSIPVVQAAAKGDPLNFFTGRMPGIYGFLELYIRGGNRLKEQALPWRATVENDALRPAGVTVGANTNDIVIWFPPDSNQAPVYVSVTQVITASRLQKRQETENKAEAKAKAETEAQAAAEAKAKTEAEAKATEEAKAKAEAEAQAKLAELMAKAGVLAIPVYTPEMVKSAQAALVAAGRMILNRASGMIQLSTIARGVLTTTSEGAGSIAGALWRGVIELSRIATVSTVGSTVGALVIGFWPKEVGLGSDQILGRDMELFAAQAQLFAAGKVNITPEMTSVNLPVRGLLVTENGRQYVSLVKTGVAGVSASVPVLRAVRDEKTGLDKITLPAVAGAPSRTILINPVPVGPTAPSNTGNSLPMPVTPVHTGTTIKQVDSIVTTTFPAEDLKGLQDFIYWQPDATGSGVEPIYVMMSDPLDSGRFTRKQLDKKFKHAADFGVADTKKNSDTLTKYRDALEAHLVDPGTVERGTYRREKGSTVYFNPKTMNVVILKADGKFLSGWKINPDAENGRIYLETGDL